MKFLRSLAAFSALEHDENDDIKRNNTQIANSGLTSFIIKWFLLVIKYTGA